MEDKISELEDEPVDDPENPEWTAEDFARARPFSEVFPEAYASWIKHGAQVVRLEPSAPKVQIGFRLAADVAAGVRATGKGYSARVERVLRDALAKGLL